MTSRMSCLRFARQGSGRGACSEESSNQVKVSVLRGYPGSDCRCDSLGACWSLKDSKKAPS